MLSAGAWTGGPTGIKRFFNFRQIRYFDIEGKLTGLHSRAMTSPAARFASRSTRAPTKRARSRNISTHYKGEGIQHIACGCRNIYETVAKLRRAGLEFMPPPPGTYYAKIDERVPGPRRARREAERARHSDRRRGRRRRRRDQGAPANFLEDRDWSHLLRVHREEGRRGLWRRQFPRSVRIRSRKTRSSAES